MDKRTILLKRIVEDSDSQPVNSFSVPPYVDMELIEEARELIKDELKYAARLEELRASLEEDMSYDELAELQSLIPYIDESDLELMEAAGVPEQVLLNNVVVTDEAIEALTDHHKNHVDILNTYGPYMTLMERLYVGEEFSRPATFHTAHGALSAALGRVRTNAIYAAHQKANVQSTESAL